MYVSTHVTFVLSKPYLLNNTPIKGKDMTCILYGFLKHLKRDVKRPNIKSEGLVTMFFWIYN